MEKAEFIEKLVMINMEYHTEEKDKKKFNILERYTKKKMNEDYTQGF